MVCSVRVVHPRAVGAQLRDANGQIRLRVASLKLVWFPLPVGAWPEPVVWVVVLSCQTLSLRSLWSLCVKLLLWRRRWRILAISVALRRRRLIWNWGAVSLGLWVRRLLRVRWWRIVWWRLRARTAWRTRRNSEVVTSTRWLHSGWRNVVVLYIATTRSVGSVGSVGSVESIWPVGSVGSVRRVVVLSPPPALMTQSCLLSFGPFSFLLVLVVFVEQVAGGDELEATENDHDVERAYGVCR